MRIAPALLLLLIATSPAWSMDQMPHVYAELSVSRTTVRSIYDVRAKAVLTNTGLQDTRVNSITMASPSLALGLFDSKGQPVGGLPPPTPPADLSKYDVTLKPGEKRSFSYELAAMFNRELRPGNYVLKMKGVDSNSVVLTIARKAKRSVQATIRRHK